MLWFLVVVLGSVSEAQDSVECVASSNALTGVRTCYEAVGNVTQRTQDAVQFAMACTDGEQCKDLWRTMINSCNPDFSGADVASLICAMPNPNTTCNDVLNNTIGYDDAYVLVLRVTASCLTGYLTNGICAAECAASLRNATDSMGCCWAEFVDILDTSLLLNASALQISWMITSLPALCNVDTPFCYDHAIPAPNDCDNFRQELFVTNAACGAAVIPFHRSQYRTGINEVLNTEGCPALYGRFTAACSPLDMASLYVFNAVGAIIGDLGQVERCRPFVPEIISNFNYPCHRSFLSRVCTDQCREAIDRGINRYGCCYRDFFRAFYGKSLNAADNTIFAFEETIYGLCGRQPTDYCRQEVVPVTDAASSCINAGNTYYSNNDFCLPYFRAFNSPLPFGNFEANVRSICVNQLCKGFLGKFSSYLRACEAFGVNADVNLLGSFDFVATLYPNATCRRNDRGSCLPVLLFSTRITAVHSAFDTDGSAACIPVFTDGQCPVECAQLLANARAEIGCCLNEYGLAFLGAENFNTLSTVCNFVATRCTEYAINPAIDECSRAENAIKANSTCSSAFTSVISILSAGARGVTIVQLDGYFNIMCQGSCGDLVSRYFTACEVKIHTDAGFRQFASDFQALACGRSDVTGLSCYAINLVEPTIKTLRTAFDPTSGICSSLLRSADNTCPTTCKTMLEEAINASGCCLNNISTQALSSLVRRVTFEDVLDACDIRTCSEYAINPAIDECARAENAIKANSTCSSAFTSVISILSAGGRGVTIGQLDGYFNIMCQGSCGDLVSRYFTACETKNDTDAGFRQFASDFQALACRRSDVTGLSCYAINLVEPTIQTLRTAFDSTTGMCSSLLISADSTCPATCKTMLEEAISATGCCLNDIITHALSSLVRRVTFEDVLDACDIMIVRTCSTHSSVLCDLRKANTPHHGYMDRKRENTGGRVFAIPAITFLALIIALLF